MSQRAGAAYNVYKADGSFKASSSKKKGALLTARWEGKPQQTIFGEKYDFTEGIGFTPSGGFAPAKRSDYGDVNKARMFFPEGAGWRTRDAFDKEYSRVREASKAIKQAGPKYTKEVVDPLGDPSSAKEDLSSVKASLLGEVTAEYRRLRERAIADDQIRTRELQQRAHQLLEPGVLRRREEAAARTLKGLGRELVQEDLAKDIEKALAGEGVMGADAAIAAKAAIRQRAKELAREAALESMPAESFTRKRRLPRHPLPREAREYVLEGKATAGKYYTAPALVLPSH